MTTRTILGRRVALAAVYVERYGLSLVFLILAGNRIHRLIVLDPAERSQIAAAPLVEILRQVMWVQLYGYAGILLLVGRRVVVPPQKLTDILLPVGTTFFYLMYAAVPWFPVLLTKNLCPIGWQTPCTVASFLLSLLGLWIVLWAAVYLGRSFSVLIEVRKVVMDGPYRQVRHPMYLGYLCFFTGFALVNFSLAYFLLVPAHIALLLYRARLEEARLAESSPEYREYQKHTGFIFPKFRGSE